MTKIHLNSEKRNESFKITSVSREDLEGQGYDTSKVSDDDMERLADKMADAYVQNSFWDDLEAIADDMGIPRIK
jgi:DNA topoisomerase VI subunit A